MPRTWNISSFIGALLAAYFIVVWAPIAWQIAVSPVFGLYQLPNVSVALYADDHLGVTGPAMVRLAWLLALARAVTVAFFVVFVVRLAVPALRRRGGVDQTLGFALAFGSLFSFACVLMASKVGEQAAVRLHAVELLMLLAAVVAMALEKPVRRPAAVSAT